MRPPSWPPTEASSSSEDTLPCTNEMWICVLSATSRVTARLLARCPSTRGWLPATNTLRLPSSAAMVLSCTY